MGFIRRLGFVACFCVGVGSLSAETAPFLAERGFLSPNFFEGGGVGKEISSVFLNPAGFPRKAPIQVAVDASQDFLGYDRYSVAAFTQYSDISFGFGYSRFSATDIAKVPFAAGRKAVQVDTLKDSYQWVVFTAGVNPKPGLTLGARAGVFEHALADDTGRGYTVDVGARQAFDFGGWVGVYSRYLSSMTVTWTKSGVKETVPRQWVYEAGYSASPFLVAFSADSNYRRAYGEWAVHKKLSVTGDTVWDEDFGSQRMSVGTVIDFGSFALSYLHLHYTETELASDQDVVGLLFRIGE